MPEEAIGVNLDEREFANKIIKMKLTKQEPADGSNVALEFRKALKLHSSRTLMIDWQSGRRWTGEQIYEATSKFATGLIKKCHLKPGQLVLMICDHDDWESLTFIGSVLAGCAVYSVLPDDGVDEAILSCQLVEAHAIVTYSRHHHFVVELRRRLPELAALPLVWADPAPALGPNSNSNNNNKSEIVDNNNADSFYNDELAIKDRVSRVDDFLKLDADEQLLEHIATKVIDAESFPVFSLLTSGSTGRPKLVELRHEQLLHSVYAAYSSTTKELLINGSREALFDIGPDDVLAGDLPLDHGVTVNTICLGILLGATIITMPSYNVDIFWQAVEDYKISTSLASATFVYKLLARLQQDIDEPIGSPRKHNWNISSLRSVYCTGSRLNFTNLIDKIYESHPHLNITQAYGCTEVGFGLVLTIAECRSHLHTVGYLFPGIKGKIISQTTGERLGPNERGELLLSAPSQFKVYKCHPEVDADLAFSSCHDAEGYYKTGDLAHYDTEGRVQLHGRLKETLFLMSDWKVMPAEIEELVNRHPLVETSTVIGIPDPDLPGCDAPKAFVKLISIKSKDFHELRDSKLHENLIEKLLAADHEFITRDIYNYTAERSAKPKHLRAGVRILDQFPTVGTLGKIDRKALKLLD